MFISTTAIFAMGISTLLFAVDSKALTFSRSMLRCLDIGTFRTAL